MQRAAQRSVAGKARKQIGHGVPVFVPQHIPQPPVLAPVKQFPAQPVQAYRGYADMPSRAVQLPAVGVSHGHQVHIHPEEPLVPDIQVRKVVDDGHVESAALDETLPGRLHATLTSAPKRLPYRRYWRRKNAEAGMTIDP